MRYNIPAEAVINLTHTQTYILRRVWRYQRGNQKPYIQEKQTTHWQWPKEKVKKHKQRSTKRTHKTKDRVTRTPLKLGWTYVRRKGSSSCSTSGTSRVNIVIQTRWLVTNEERTGPSISCTYEIQCEILFGYHMLRHLFNILYFLWLYDEFFDIVYNIYIIYVCVYQLHTLKRMSYVNIVILWDEVTLQVPKI